ncbi:alpha/beta hydrolase family protein [Haloferula chungangensis]|uniref:Alpha/beta hydrolase family protein n=1 Tax=Haloferula chungangensis TaxID=1048331 RepID=A0ABW2L9B5_9BACT
MIKNLKACLILGMSPLLVAGTLFAAPEVMGPEEIWEGYDPRAIPLDEEILKTWEEDGASYKEVYFNGEKIDGKQVRLYGVFAAPTGARKLPALLHIHGGGQTVNRDWLKEFSKRGYAILSINWGGEWPKRDRYTLWNGVENGDHKKRSGTQVTEPSPRSDAYYLWTQASMRAITYLEKQDEVDPDKIGAFGISMGGTIMWNLAFDPRIKAGCAIYGAGWNSYAHQELRYAIGHPGKKASEKDLRWRASLAPEASAPFVRFPMLFLSSSNDRHGYMDRAEQSLDLIPEGVPRAWALTPRIRHHIGVDFIHDLPGWMDVHLKGEGVWPANPKAKITLGEGKVPVFYVKPDRPDEVTKVEVFHALENPFAVNRHWRSSEPSESDGVYSSPAPVMHADEYLFGFANVSYKSGVVISSPLVAVVPDTIGAEATISQPSRVFYDGKEGVGDWTRNSTGTDPIPGRVDKRLEAVLGPGGKPGFTANRVSPMTYAPSDPEFRAPHGASLAFEIKTEEDQEFTVKLHKNYWVNDFETFACKVDLKGSRDWQTVTLDGSQFLSEKSGKPLGESINEAGVLELNPSRQSWTDRQVIFGNFHWVGGEHVPHVHAYRDNKARPDRGVPGSDDAGHLQDHEAVKE